jgi:hypothetical protein
VLLFEPVYEGALVMVLDPILRLLPVMMCVDLF